MTESIPPYGDALTRPFWDAAAEHRLVMQLCRACGRHQFYPRPFCLACYSDEVEWTDSPGLGTVYAVSTVEMAYDPAFTPPYTIAIVELDEKTRLLTQIVEGVADIGDRVTLVWHERSGLPPLPFFRPITEVKP